MVNKELAVNTPKIGGVALDLSPVMSAVVLHSLDILVKYIPPTNPHWARVVGYGPFSLWLIHKEGLCPSSGDINRLMMMIHTTHALSREG
jgi:hypothetical protein